jgi:hypothetical protein
MWPVTVHIPARISQRAVSEEETVQDLQTTKRLKKTGEKRIILEDFKYNDYFFDIIVK